MIKISSHTALLLIIILLLASCSLPQSQIILPEPSEETALPVDMPTSSNLENDATPTPTVAPTPVEHTVFSKGIYIDGIDLNGMTMEEARTQVLSKQQIRLMDVGVTLQYGDKSWKFTSKDVICNFNTDTVMQNAWDLSERIYLAVQSDNFSLFSVPILLRTRINIDASPIEQKVRNLAFSFYIPFENSTFAGYDPAKPDGQRLTFTQAKSGKQVDADALWAAVQKEFADNTYGTVPIQYVDVPAKISQQSWLKNMTLIWRFNSIQNSSPARYTNIKIACSQISGHFIMPGEVFSFNDTTGERTAEKGYQMAHVINGGVVDNGLAGGTCQVSGTLFNAAIRAGLTIAERHHHTLRSAYLPLGQDATVDYGHYDLKLKNDSDSPMLIIMYLGTGRNSKKVYAEIYGKSLPAGETIEVTSKITETIPAPATVSYATSTAVKPGSTETVKPHEGWKVTTYRIYKKNGKAVKTVVLYTDYYKEAGTIIVYNPADPKPTQALSPTPASTPKPN